MFYPCLVFITSGYLQSVIRIPTPNKIDCFNIGLCIPSRKSHLTLSKTNLFGNTRVSILLVIFGGIAAILELF